MRGAAVQEGHGEGSRDSPPSTGASLSSADRDSAEVRASEDQRPRGYGVQAVREGRTKLNSDISINPSGGLKSKGHPIGATGVGQVVEVFDQLTGKAGERAVKNAKIGLTHNFGATGASCAVHIFQSV